MTDKYYKSIQAILLGNQEKKQSQKYQKKLKLKLFLIFFVALTTVTFFFSIFYFYSPKFGYNQSRIAKHGVSIDARKETQSLPIRLKIAAINVDAPIESVGLTSEGAMDVPSDTTNIGWFKFGPRPGNKGSAVMAGHFNKKDGQEGIFNNLNKLKRGDKIYVEQENGQSVTFVVRETRIYNPGYVATVFNPNDHEYLNLVTCDGVWNKVTQKYNKRLVVFSDLVK